MTPEQRKQQTRKEQAAGRAAVWRADILELDPITVLKLKEEKTTVKLKIYTERKDMGRLVENIRNVEEKFLKNST